MGRMAPMLGSASQADGLMNEGEKQAILEALARTNWVQKDAAGLLRIGPRVPNDRIKTSWSRRSGLNRRPADYESAALPLSYAGARGRVTGEVGWVL